MRASAAMLLKAVVGTGWCAASDRRRTAPSAARILFAQRPSVVAVSSAGVGPVLLPRLGRFEEIQRPPRSSSRTGGGRYTAAIAIGHDRRRARAALSMRRRIRGRPSITVCIGRARGVAGGIHP